MANDKAPGATGVTTDMMKNLPPKATLFYSELIQEFWNNKETNFDSWYETLLIAVNKGKNDPQDPNNHRGVCLKESSQRS